MYLNEERQRIHELAGKYGLENNVKVKHLQLIQVGRGPEDADPSSLK